MGQRGSSVGGTQLCLEFCFSQFPYTIYFKRGFCSVILSSLVKSFPLCMSHVTLCPSHCGHLWAVGYSPSFMENNDNKLPHFTVIPAIMWSSWSRNISKTLLAKINCHFLIGKPSRLFWSSFYLTLSDIQLLCSEPFFLKCIYFLFLKYLSVLYISYFENKYKMVITKKVLTSLPLYPVCARVHRCTCIYECVFILSISHIFSLNDLIYSLLIHLNNLLQDDDS